MISRKQIVLAVVAVVLALGAYWILAGGNTKDYRFANLGQAREANLIQKGILPAWVPFSARDIRVRHTPNHNEWIASFDYSGNPDWVLRTPCAEIRREQLRPPSVSASWWPSNLPPLPTRSHTYTFYDCGQLSPAYMAIDKASDHVFVWGN